MVNKGTISILGGSGFVGSALCTALYKQGYAIRLFTRNPSHCRHLYVLPSLRVIQIDEFSPETIASQLEGSIALINLVGILNESTRDGAGFHQAHVEVTRAALLACEKTMVRRFLQMSALHADAKGLSHYLRSKGKAENYLTAFAKPFIDVTIFQPSVIFGPNDQFLNRFAKLLRWAPGIFPLACPTALFAPVYVGDVVKSMVNSIDDESTFGTTIQLCGPKTYSLKELVCYVAKLSGKKRLVIGLPRLLSKLQALVLERFPGKPFSVDNFNSLQIDSICGEANYCETALEAIAPFYLAAAHSQGSTPKETNFPSRSIYT